MQLGETHLSDETLLSAADGELSARDAAQVADHMAACWACRTRKQELEAAVSDFVRVYQRTSDHGEIPSARGPRALLIAQMAELSGSRPRSWFRFSTALAGLAGIAAVIVAVYLVSILWLGTEPKQVSTLMLPDRNLTPGATVLMGRDEVCRASGTGNKMVPVALQREVFRKYRMRAVAGRAYEVDYLITPALGGADDIHNLWPESYSAVWNARVKDQLENYLRDRVCAGALDLATAQQDLAANWIDAYKRYFHTDRPLDEAHRP